MARAKNGQAISAERKSRAERRRLKRFLAEAERKKDLATWRRAMAILGYIGGKSVISLDERDEALRNTFYLFRRKPGLISAHVARYR